MVLKDADARVAVAVDWARAFPDGPGIAASDWRVADGLGEARPLVVADAAADWLSATAMLEGGQAGRSYELVNRVTLTDGQVDVARLCVRVDAR